MKYFNVKFLVEQGACKPVINKFKRMFGDKAKVSLKNVEKFLGRGYKFSNYVYGTWLLRKLLGVAPPEIERIFYKVAGVGYADQVFDYRRSKAIYQLLKVVKESDAINHK